jgi:ferredoxin
VKVRVDPDICTGHGRCYDLAPEVFTDDEAGHCVLRSSQVPSDHEGAARLAADNCPERAIQLEE